MKKIFIKDCKAQNAVESVFLLRKKEMQRTKDNKPYLRLSVCDKTGSLEARVWENAEAYNAQIEAGQAVVVKGTLELWKDALQIKVESIRRAETGEYALEDLLRTVEDREKLFKGIRAYLDACEDKWLRALTKRFLDDSVFIDKFMRSPGARSWHNAYIGGLLEHTYEVMYIVEKTCALYPEAKKDLCLTGAFLHDIGKIFEIDAQTFEYTYEGNLIGHLPLGFELLSRAISELQGFPGELALLLKHIVLSHHGEYEQQSPILPKTLEATIVYHADELVSQANAVKEHAYAQKNTQQVRSTYISIKNRKYLIKDLTADAARGE